MAIRYDQKLNNEIRRIVNNYNAKIRRLNKREDLTLPPLFDRQALKSMKQSTKSRADLRRKLKNLQEFSKRGGEQTTNFAECILRYTVCSTRYGIQNATSYCNTTGIIIDPLFYVFYYIFFI